MKSQASDFLQGGGIVGVNLWGLAGVGEGGFQVADAQRADVEIGVPVEGNVLDGEVQIVGALNGGENQGAVFDAAAHGPGLVETPAEGHDAVAADAAEGGTQSGDTANGGRRDDRASGFGSDGETDQAGGGGGSWSGG